jgi:hypothetical protein
MKCGRRNQGKALKMWRSGRIWTLIAPLKGTIHFRDCKMVFKLLANCLRVCIDNCISEEQSAFVEGCSILDNAMIAMEVIHSLKRRTRGRKGELALKIDISKAYDKIDRGFLKGMLLRLSFSEKCIQCMMMCVSTVNYSVLMNFDKAGPIYPGRGLRQGDLLSPYLFILTTEGLTALIKQSIGRGDLHGIKICRGHLWYLIFYLQMIVSCFAGPVLRRLLF